MIKIYSVIPIDAMRVRTNVVFYKHNGILQKKSYKIFIWNHNTYMQKERHITCISSKNIISMEEKQELHLVAQKSHFASIVIKHNPRPMSSCLFSSSWITDVWEPRLCLTLYIGENNQEHLFDYFGFPLLFLSKRTTRKLSLFLSKEKR